MLLQKFCLSGFDILSHICASHSVMKIIAKTQGLEMSEEELSASLREDKGTVSSELLGMPLCDAEDKWD